MKKLFYFLFLGLALASCHKDLEETTIVDEVYTPPVIKVNGSISGQLVTENGNAIEGAIVRVGDQQQETGPGGYFIFRDVVLNANGTYIKVDQPGYFHASKRFYPKANTMNYTTLTLMSKPNSGQISATTGGTVTLASGASVTLPANGIVGANNTPYNGMVNVAARWLDPSAANIGDIMPGNLHGISEDNKEVALATYGMLAVELTGSNGEKLNIRSGASATIKAPIPASLQNNAPAEIPLWYFDENTGLWREDGVASKQGDSYVGVVEHFTFWNYDYPYPLVNIEGRIVNADGDPVANVGIRVTILGTTLTGYGFTDADGHFSGGVPANQNLTLTVQDWFCGEDLLQTNIGPFSADTNVGDLEADDSNSGFTTLHGNVVNCDNDPVSDAIVQICRGNNYCQFAAITSAGSFDFTFAHCDGDDFTITVFDLEDETQGTPQTVSVGQEEDVNLGNISACASQITEFVRLNINGEEAFYPLPYYFGQAGALRYVGAFAQDSSYSMQVGFPVGAPGTYTGPGVSFGSYWFSPAYMSGYCQNPCSDVTVVVTEFGNVGEYIRGTFSGNVDFHDANQQSLGNLPVSGEFAVIRLQ